MRLGFGIVCVFLWLWGFAADGTEGRISFLVFSLRRDRITSCRGEKEGLVGGVQIRHLPCYTGCHDVRICKQLREFGANHPLRKRVLCGLLFHSLSLLSF